MISDLNRLLDKVLEMFYNYGISAVSMDDVCSQIGISKKTLYQLFNDKHNLVERVENHQFNETDSSEYDQKLYMGEMFKLHACGVMDIDGITYYEKKLKNNKLSKK